MFDQAFSKNLKLRSAESLPSGFDPEPKASKCREECEDCQRASVKDGTENKATPEYFWHFLGTNQTG